MASPYEPTNPPTPPQRNKSIDGPGKVGLLQPVLRLGQWWSAIRLLTNIPTGKSGHNLTDISFKVREKDVLVVIRKDSPKGRMVAFVDAPSLDLALWRVAQMIEAKQLGWKVDKWRNVS